MQFLCHQWSDRLLWWRFFFNMCWQKIFWLRIHIFNNFFFLWLKLIAIFCTISLNSLLYSKNLYGSRTQFKKKCLINHFQFMLIKLTDLINLEAFLSNSTIQKTHPFVRPFTESIFVDFHTVNETQILDKESMRKY